eukprot:TRINITY_DN36941_c0_g1_i1.p1 TRINITY_DN36941_c0_g1~~TRINITY_DN36941_c0_g1_i1.p1  ORF type:complete len:289 (+),score=34.76 TRINITY_DN36941_c0_g1_i1:142-1008(+)
MLELGLGGKLLFAVSIIIGMLSSALLWEPIPMSSEEVQKRYGPWAMVIGGDDVAVGWVKELKNLGLSVILVTDKNRIESSSITGIPGVASYSIDFLADNSVFFINQTLTRDIGLVILNPLPSKASPFLQSDLLAHNNIIDSNIRNTVTATSIFLSHFVETGRTSGIIFITSVTSLQGISGKVTYAASKSFLNSFSLGLHNEYSSTTNVDILSCLSGDLKADWKVPVAQAAQQCLHALPLGISSLTVGWFSRMLSSASPYFLISAFSESGDGDAQPRQGHGTDINRGLF